MTLTFRRSMAGVLALAMLVTAPGPGFAQRTLPALGEAASEDFDLGTEKRLGEQIMRDIRRDPAYLDDPVLLDYLQSLWRPLVEVARRSGHIDQDTGPLFAWELFLVRDRSVNAFALPGGHVGVHLGLVAMTGSGDELASVLAHELSHVTQRHIARSVGSSQRASMVGLAAMILGVLAASRSGNMDAAQAAIVGSQAAMIQGQLNFSRDMEREADRVGFGLLDGAGYSARGMAAMFEKLELANRHNDGGAFPYLRSHPLTTERIGEARARVDEQLAPLTPAPLHALMRARARVLMDPTAAAWRRLQQDAGAGETALELMTNAYQRALASARLLDAPAARQALAELSRRAALYDAETRRAAQRLVTEVELALGEPTAAQQALASHGAAAGRPGLLLRGESLLAPAAAPEQPLQLRALAEDLQVWTAEHPNDARAWAMLAQATQAIGLGLRSQRAQAESRAASGDLAGAIDQLRAAQRSAPRAAPAELIELHVIDARLRALESLQRELRADLGRGR